MGFNDRLWRTKTTERKTSTSATHEKNYIAHVLNVPETLLQTLATHKIHTATYRRFCVRERLRRPIAWENRMRCLNRCRRHSSRNRLSKCTTKPLKERKCRSEKNWKRGFVESFCIIKLYNIIEPTGSKRSALLSD